jgi:branched-chain amino acid transport system permease protein
MNSAIRSTGFLLACVAVAALVFAGARMAENDYVFFAGYTVLQFVVLATAWNILGGLTGYVNFGAAAFFACGAYSTVFFHKAYPLPIPALVAISAVVSGLIGLGMGYLTLRLRGVYFAIATLAMAVVLRTLVTNWDFVGGARGAYVIRPGEFKLPDLPYLEGLSLPYIQYLFLIMLALAVIAVAIARTIERSKLGYGFATIRDDEMAAEASGVPTLKLKLIATTLSGALMGMAGAPFPYYIGYLQPSSAFALDYAVNSIAMPLIGGTTSWVGPVVGAVLLGSLEQYITVTVRSEANLLIVGILLVDFVIIAPSGLVGLVRDRRASLDIAASVYVLVYVLNLFPLLFLPRGLEAALIAMVFWIILAFVAYARGRTIGRPWLVAAPMLGASLWFRSAVTASDITALVLAVAAISVQFTGIIGGFRFERLRERLRAKKAFR